MFYTNIYLELYRRRARPSTIVTEPEPPFTLNVGVPEIDTESAPFPTFYVYLEQFYDMVCK